MPSGGGSFIWPSKIHCTHICGLQVAVSVGLEGDPLGRNVLGPLVSVSVIVVVVEVIGILGLMVVSPSAATVGTSAGSSNITTWFHSFTVANKCLVEARSSSQLASLVLKIFLGVLHD